MVSNPKAWKTVFEAKEPHSLPLHEPWYSRLDRFLKLLLVGRLRPDKLCDMAFSYVSDHVGYKFVEPVVLDLGRVFSESEAWQALIYTINGPNEAAKSIRAFADDKGKELLRLSMQDVRVTKKRLRILVSLLKEGYLPPENETLLDLAERDH